MAVVACSGSKTKEAARDADRGSGEGAFICPTQVELPSGGVAKLADGESHQSPCVLIDQETGVSLEISLHRVVGSSDMRRLAGQVGSELESQIDEALVFEFDGEPRVRVLARQQGTVAEVFLVDSAGRSPSVDDALAAAVAALMVDGQAERGAFTEEPVELADCSRADLAGLADLIGVAQVEPLYGAFGCEVNGADGTHIRVERLESPLAVDDLDELTVQGSDGEEPLRGAPLEVAGSPAVWLGDPSNPAAGSLYVADGENSYSATIVLSASAEREPREIVTRAAEDLTGVLGRR